MSIPNKAQRLRRLLSLGSLIYPFIIYWCVKDNQADLMWPLFYPVCMNLVMAFIFGGSLVYPPTIIERIARRREPNLDERGVAYTRQVTNVWFGFCLINAMISLCTVMSGNLKLWTLYNGVISYGLMGILFVGEYCVRYHLRRQSRF